MGNAWDNLPPGVRDTDLPGYNDVEEVREESCFYCDWSDEIEVVIDKTGRYSTYFFDCPKCGKENQTELDNERDVDFDDIPEKEPYWPDEVY